MSLPEGAAHDAHNHGMQGIQAGIRRAGRPGRGDVTVTLLFGCSRVT